MPRPFPPLFVEPEVTGSRTVLLVEGEVDIATTPRLGAAVDAALAAEVGCELTIVCPPGPVGRVLDLSGVGELIPRTS